MVNEENPELSNKVRQAYAKLAQRLKRDRRDRGFLLLLIDAESESPKNLEARLLARAKQAQGNIEIACVLPKAKFENWIVGGASTLAGVNGLPDKLPRRQRFEESNGVAWLDQQLRTKNPQRKYKKTVDAPIFVQHMNLSEARKNCPSLDKLCKELEKWAKAHH